MKINIQKGKNHNNKLLNVNGKLRHKDNYYLIYLLFSTDVCYKQLKYILTHMTYTYH